MLNMYLHKLLVEALAVLMQMAAAAAQEDL
jgi:hypothetical protein